MCQVYSKTCVCVHFCIFTYIIKLCCILSDIFVSVDMFIFGKGDRRKPTCTAENPQTTNSASVPTHLVKYIGAKISPRIYWCKNEKLQKYTNLMTEKIVNKLKHINADKSLSSHIFFCQMQIFYIATIFVRKHNKRKLFSI